MRFYKANFYAFFDRKRYHRLQIPSNHSYFFVLKNDGVIALNETLKTSTRITYFFSNKDETIARYKKVGEILEKVKSDITNNHFPNQFEYKIYPEEKIIVEKTNFFYNSRPINAHEWPKILCEKLNDEIIAWYKTAGIESQPFKKVWESLKLSAPKVFQMPILLPAIKYIESQLQSSSHTYYTTFVISDLTRFNTLRNKNTIRLIDFAGSSRLNLLHDLYTQERWYTTPSFWKNIHLNTPIPHKTSVGWLKLFKEKFKEETKITLTDDEIKLHYLMCLFSQISRFKKPSDFSKHPILNAL